MKKLARRCGQLNRLTGRIGPGPFGEPSEPRDGVRFTRCRALSHLVGDHSYGYGFGASHESRYPGSSGGSSGEES